MTETEGSHRLALVVTLAGTTEPVLEQVVGHKLREHAGTLPSTVSQYPGNGQPRVVVQSLPRRRPGMLSDTPLRNENADT